jgi:hypothetical protein
MTLVLVLNLLLAIAVVGVVLRLLSWAIISSRSDQVPVVSEIRHPAPRRHSPHPHAPHPHWPSVTRQQQGSRDSADPVAG